MADDAVEDVQISDGRMRVRVRRPNGDILELDLPSADALAVMTAGETARPELEGKAKRQQVAAGLRYLADLLEQHPGMHVPTVVNPEAARVLVPVSAARLAAIAALLGQTVTGDQLVAGPLVFTLAK